MYVLAAVPVLRKGSPNFLIHFQPSFLKPLFIPVVPAVVPLCKCASFFAFSMVEFTPFSFHFSHSVQEQYLHDLTQVRSPFVDLSSYRHQII